MLKIVPDVSLSTRITKIQVQQHTNIIAAYVNDNIQYTSVSEYLLNLLIKKMMIYRKLTEDQIKMRMFVFVFSICNVCIIPVGTYTLI